MGETAKSAHKLFHYEINFAPIAHFQSSTDKFFSQILIFLQYSNHSWKTSQCIFSFSL